MGTNGGQVLRYHSRHGAMPYISPVYFLLALAAVAQKPVRRPRAAEIGLTSGNLPRGALDAITDVAGVRVGHTTLVRGNDVRTGVTVILPHPGNLFRDKVPGAVFIGNAFGKLAGSPQLEEPAPIETPPAPPPTLNSP